jgi:DNA-binding response OmpR family regulator
MASEMLKVLVAEDEPTMLNLIAEHVRRLGLSVLEAPDGDVAWTLAREHVPDLVILDVMMPGLSGWDVCKRLRSPAEGDRFKSTGVIMLTGIGESLNAITSPLFGADASLDKPFQFDELDATIRAILARYGKNPPAEGSAAAAPKKAARRVASRSTKRASVARKTAAPARKKAAKPAKKAGKTAKKATKKSALPRASAKKAARKAAKKNAAKKGAKKGAAKNSAAKHGRK